MSDIAITAANVLRSANGNPAQGIIAAATTVTAGKALHQLANGTYGLADSNGSSPANSFAGISLTGGGAGQPVIFCTLDSAFVSGGTLTSGDVIYLSNTAGGITATYADLASGSTVISLGVVNTDGTLNLNPTTGGTK